MASIKKTFGEGVAISGSEVLDEDTVVIPVSPAIDPTLGGGIPKGRWVSFAGKPKLGKTTSALHFAAKCQALGMEVWYGDIEARLKKKNLDGIRGLNGAKVKVIRSTKDKILTGQNFLEIFTHLLMSKSGIVIIIDSISALCDEREMLGGVGTETRGSGAKMLSQFVRTICQYVPIQKSIVIGITHLIANTSGFGPPIVERAANAWVYQADVRMRIKSMTPWMVGADKDGKGGKRIGQVVHWQCEESALGAPGRECDSYIRYGIGIDETYELMKWAVTAELIEKAGAWYTLSYMRRHLDLLGVAKWDEAAAKKVKAQGEEKLYQLLQANGPWCNALADEMRELTSHE